MSEPPPPSGPPAGWYPDPVTRVGYRWWDGSAWTDATSSADATGPAGPSGGPAVPGRIGRVDALLTETLRLSFSRAGHLLPLIVLFMLSFGLVSSVALWFGLRDTVLTFDEAASEPPTIDYGGSAIALWIYLALIPISLLGGAVVQAATARQTWAAKAGRPETWSASLAGTVARWRPLLVGTVGKWVAYVAVGGGFAVATALSPAFVITFPIVVIVLALLWLRLSFVGQAAVLAPAGSRPLSTSYRVSGGQAAKLFVRLIVLVLAGAAVLLVITLIGSLFTAFAGAEGATPIDPDDLTYDLNAAFGDNLAAFVLGAVFGSLALGGATAVVATGTTLLYGNLEGPVASDLAVVGDAEEPSLVTGPNDETTDGTMLG